METRRMSIWNSLALAAVVSAAHAGGTTVPTPAALLDAVLAPASIPYTGQVVAIQWFGKQTKAEEMRVFASPPGRVRREFLLPDGTVDRVSISDGESESVHLIRQNKLVVGNAVRSYDKVLPVELEHEVLLSNYTVESSTGDPVAGRTTWCLSLRPRTPGKPWEVLWIDRETHVILRTKRFLPRRPFASESQFISFETKTSLDESTFDVEDSSSAIESRNLAPAFLTLDQLNRATGASAGLPDRLAGGFVFESADVFNVGRSIIRHARYTDGLTALSLFLTDRPVKLHGTRLTTHGVSLPGAIHATSVAKLLGWKSGLRHFTLMGDVSISREIFTEISKTVR
jgi:outer membrane lipoprotein-sorting protein